MTWITTREPSLLDTAHLYPVEWWLVYTDSDRRKWWNRWLQPRFQHVAALRRDGRVWIFFRPHGEFLDVELVRSDQQPAEIEPNAVVQRVVALRAEGRLRSSFFVGPITCVEHVKSLLGIRSFWIRTPFQLYRHLRRQP